MIIKIDAVEKDLVSETLLKLGLKFRFFTIENNPLLLQCEVDDISAACAFHIGRSVQLTAQMHEEMRQVKRFPYNLI